MDKDVEVVAYITDVEDYLALRQAFVFHLLDDFVQILLFDVQLLEAGRLREEFNEHARLVLGPVALLLGQGLYNSALEHRQLVAFVVVGDVPLSLQRPGVSRRPRCVVLL